MVISYQLFLMLINLTRHPTMPQCVFGRVLDAESLMTVRKCELVPTKGGANQPRYPLRVVECGEL